jgi:hypothetical protein
VFVKSQLHNFTTLVLVPTLSSTTSSLLFLDVEAAPVVTTEPNLSLLSLKSAILETSTATPDQMLAEPTADSLDVETELLMLENNAITVPLTLLTEPAEVANSPLAVTVLLIPNWVSNATTETTFLETVVQETAHLSAETAVSKEMKPVMTDQPTPTCQLLIPVLAVLLVNSKSVVMVSLILSWVNNVTEDLCAEPTAH